LAGSADGNKDGVVDSDELYSYTLDQVALVGERELNARQTPVRIIGEDVVGRFVLARVAPGPHASATVDRSRQPSMPSNSTRPASPSAAGTTNTAGAFQRLFNGKDLSGWKVVGNAKHSWKVDGGLIEGSAGPPPSSILVTERTDFANFHLRVETMMPDGFGSGIHFRMLEPDSDRARNFGAAIAPARPEGKRSLHDTGTLSFFSMPGPRITLAEADPVVPIKPDEWFFEEVIADGDVITVFVKGFEVAKFQVLHRKLTSGAIGLGCNWHSKVVFRTIEIKELVGARKEVSPASGLGSRESPEAMDSNRTATEWRGHWQNEKGELVQKSLEPNAAIYFGDSTWTDYTFSADVQLVRGTGHAGLFFRAGGVRGRGDYFFTVSPPGDRAALMWRFFDGDFHLLARRRAKDAVLTAEKWQKMKIDVQGNNFTAYLDGKAILTASDNAMARGGVGLKASEAICRFRNIRVTAPDGKILWRALPVQPNSRSIGVSLRSHESAQKEEATGRR
jgi:hypothetical protein